MRRLRSKPVLAASALLTLAALLFSSGCIGLHPFFLNGQDAPSHTEAPVVSQAPSPSPAPLPSPSPTPSPTREPQAYVKAELERAKTLLDEAIPYIRRHPSRVVSSPHPFVPADKRASLSGRAAEVYDQMLASAEVFEPVTVICADAVLKEALEALLYDRPDIEVCFDMQKDLLAHSAAGSVWRSVYFLPDGRYFREADDVSEVIARVTAFREVGAYVASRIPAEFSAVDRYRLIAYFISANTDYANVHGEIPRYAQNAYGAVMNGYSICQGYAIGFEYLCRMADLDCRRVRNARNDDRMHFWDIVTLDSGAYYVDVTWCDGSADDYTQEDWRRWFLFTAEERHVSNDGTTTTGPDLSTLWD